MSPYFFLEKKSDDLFLVIASESDDFFSCRLLTTPIFPRRLSSVLSKFGPTPPADATDLRIFWCSVLVGVCMWIHSWSRRRPSVERPRVRVTWRSIVTEPIHFVLPMFIDETPTLVLSTEYVISTLIINVFSVFASYIRYMVHELVPTIFELAAPPVLPRFFLQIPMVQHLYFLFQLVSRFKSCPFGLETACFSSTLHCGIRSAKISALRHTSKSNEETT